MIALDGAKYAAATCTRRLWTFFTCEWALGVAKVLQSITLLVSTVDVFLKLLAKDTASGVGVHPTQDLAANTDLAGRDPAYAGTGLVSLGWEPRLHHLPGRPVATSATVLLLRGGSALWQA